MTRPRQRSPAFLLRPRDRVVFVGDSITEQRTFTNDVENYLVGRYPELKLECVNAGWGGDTTANGVKRLERDVLALDPDVVLFCYGMNDAGWGYAKPAEAAQRYSANLLNMIRRLRRHGARVALLTPGVVDDTLPGLGWLKAITDYNAVDLHAIKRATLTVARVQRLPAYDLHALMGRVLRKTRRHGLGVGPDGIHPDAAASLLMTYAALKVLGVPRWREEHRVDLTPGKGRVSRGITGLVSDDRSVRFAVLPSRLPVFIEEKARAMLAFVPLLEEFGDLRLVVRGLASPRWSLRIDGRLGPVVSRAELARGIRLSDMWGTELLERSRKMSLVTREKANAYRQFWRAVALPDNYIVDAAYDPEPHRLASKFAERVDRWRHKRLGVPPLAVELTAVTPERLPALPGAPLTRWAVDRDFSGGVPSNLTPAARLAISRPGRKLPAGWRPVLIPAGNREPLRHRLYAPGALDKAEGLVSIFSSAGQTAKLTIGPGVTAHAFVNGRKAGNVPQEATERTLRVNLRKGANRILFSFSEKGGQVAALPVTVTSLPRPAWQTFEEATLS